MRRNIILLVVLFIICAVVFYFLLKLPDNSARKAGVCRHPQRIISLGPSVTKAVYLLGAQDKLIADTVYCIDPPEVKKKEKIGTVTEVNIEKIFNLKPDLVLATSLTNSKAREKLKNLGVRVVTFSTLKDFNDICNQFLELGRLVDKENEAKEIVKSVESEIILIKEKVKGLHKPKVFVQMGVRPLFAATGSYFVNDYIEFAGGINIAKEAKRGIYSREQILKENPDVIIITTMGAMGMAAEEEKSIWQKYKTLSAAKSGRIYIIDTDEITAPTPQSFVKTLADFEHILHSGEQNEK
ncbi:MAG: ABC transporter substrate-binding protein [Candidatus Omnitrophica bacterium]|nr:ABC transporter substrate-binding protein [Candidatus Omnitrophota bacterium]MBU4303451.1 ABC transporter substrate-binding protein [Candidatus Omnitrophota bacterium]MBU4419007.1 ABC transporter substrate-binding protein [Candidatus Omnitrophota bacterium]MBU4468289.1 ABC transporter substrate-binding protein [Candidatus Omnitrophota bacterium]MCG2713849.1 ABC transporter substrate-binding protein [Candidatus Omnitrophota bacterium]